jgi:serine/threonine protein phosphatase 1
VAYTFAIGDIHGCHRELESLLSLIEFEARGGTVVFLGDYVDRGPDSRAVVERIMTGPISPGWRWIPLKGNHEELMVRARRRDDDPLMWLTNGGGSTLVSFGGDIPASVLDWADTLPLYFEDRYRVFVHSGVVDESVPLAAQESRTLLWRRPFPGEGGDYWGKHLVHGHTPSDDNPETIGNRTNIDTGCAYGGGLTAAVFDDDRPGAPLRFLRVASGQAA